MLIENIHPFDFGVLLKEEPDLEIQHIPIVKIGEKFYNQTVSVPSQAPTPADLLAAETLGNYSR